jgi:hypothetical protein
MPAAAACRKGHRRGHRRGPLEIAARSTSRASASRRPSSLDTRRPDHRQDARPVFHAHGLPPSSSRPANAARSDRGNVRSASARASSWARRSASGSSARAAAAAARSRGSSGPGWAKFCGLQAKGWAKWPGGLAVSSCGALWLRRADARLWIWLSPVRVRSPTLNLYSYSTCAVGCRAQEASEHQTIGLVLDTPLAGSIASTASATRCSGQSDCAHEKWAKG